MFTKECLIQFPVKIPLIFATWKIDYKNCKASAKRLQHASATYRKMVNGLNPGVSVLRTSFFSEQLSPGRSQLTKYRNIVERNYVASFCPPCCDMLGVVGSSLKMVKLEQTATIMSQNVETRWPMLRWHVVIVWPGLNRIVKYLWK